MGSFSFKRLLVSIGLLSASMIAYQLSLMQYLSIIQWYHFAYMVIAIALLGFGGAGTFLALFRKRLIENIGFLLPLFMVLSGIFMSLSIWLSSQPFASFDTYLLFVEQKEIWRLLLFELLFFVPFFFCALAIGMAFIKYTSRIGKLYFSNLVGSGLGGILAIVLFWNALPIEIPFITGILAIISAGIVIPYEKRIWWGSSILIMLVICFFFTFQSPLSLKLSQYKSLSRTLDLPDTEIKAGSNSPYGWVQYVSSPVLRYAPGLSLSYTGEVPVTDAIFNNGDWAGAVLASEEDSEIHNYTTSALATEIATPEKILVLDAGTGIRSLYYSRNGGVHVDHVEANPLVTQFSSEKIDPDNSFKHYQQDARSFLSESEEQYDLVSLPDIGAFGGTAGLQAIQEEYLFTIDGFLSIFDHLENNGLISVTVWMDYPYRNPLKITATLVETLVDKSISDPSKHLVAVRSWNTITYLLKKEAFTEGEIRKVREFCERLSFDPLLLPDISPGERDKYNALQDQSLFRLNDQLLADEREDLYETYDFNIKPATDEKPYFSQFLKWKSFSHLQELFGGQSASFFELGYLIVGVTFLQSLLLAFILIILPLFFLKRKIQNMTWTLLYFAGIGIGFMFVEIVLIQRFILFLGHPVYSVAAVISVMLLLSGAGSWLSENLPKGPISMRTILLIITGILVLYAFGLPWVLKMGMGLAGGVKMVVSLVLIGLPAFFMGMPFPLGLRYLSEKNEQEVPWAWGINGCLSVVSTSLATIIAVEAGFSVLILLGALAYLVTMLSCYLKV
ncbi:class I SAM-dependent methyltransferase [Gramella jeungdoensis]|uniref:Class I SAM-dependent methyltransferase n=1 Tax=Gramella jeungdoensis TaxID=708091 RepID=A0ABT0Z3D6_9FLAO|nr:class I SAM-dependent methyltransferase [Gramella jeungdoensis]MCM8570251.1 class I SAM-dependent methyltransferase [Gramella jeungdoensis]